MATDLNSDNLITRYLLDELSEEQQIEIEDRAFSDQEFLAGITAVENDLIDEYVRDEMPESDRHRFEKRFLASESRRKRVEFARALTRVMAETRVTERETPTVVAAPVSWRDLLAAFINGLHPAGKLALAAAMLLVLIGGAWLITETLRLRSRLTQLQAQQQSQQSATGDRQALERQLEMERRRSEELAAQLDREKQQRAQTDESLRRLSETVNRPDEASRPVIASLMLLPGISRGATTQPKLVLPAGATVAQIQIGIEPEEDYKSFGVELRTISGRSVWTRDNLTARNTRGGRAVRLALPASVLSSGEYELRLKGVTATGETEDVGFYYFAVTKRAGAR
ncbi:MAG TPA: hypothetical protein VFS77_09020 [Pyrinomonadaceae bacterium]|nr:hypothetical protein [Pyrinomonadaceae bacterium]